MKATNVAREFLIFRGLDALIVGGRAAAKEYGVYRFVHNHLPPTNGSYIVTALSGSDYISWVMPRVFQRSTADWIPESNAAHLLGLLQGLGVKNIGFAGTAVLSSLGVNVPELARVLGVDAFDDVTEELEGLKACRNGSRFDEIRSSGLIANAGLGAFAESARPGMSELEAHELISHTLREESSEFELIHVVSTGAFMGQDVSTRRFSVGDLVSVFVEVCGPSGGWAEIGAVFAIGPISQEANSMARHAIDALDGVQPLVRGGQEVGVLARWLDGHVRKRGFVSTVRLGHGVGIDEEEPNITSTAPGTLVHGSALALHPSVARKDLTSGVAVANTFLLKNHVVEALSEWPRALNKI